MHDFIGVEGVLPPERLAELNRRSDAKGLVRLAGHLGALAASTVALWLSWGTWIAVPLFALQGTLIAMLYAPLHECDHFTAFESRWLNVWVARLVGFLMIYPSDIHRWSHYAHHRHTQDWSRDAELTARRPYDSVWPYAWALLGWGNLARRMWGIVRLALRGPRAAYFTERQYEVAVVACRWYLAGYAVLAAVSVVVGSWAAVTLWLAPHFVMRWTYAIQSVGEHTGLTNEPNTLLNTRTFDAGPFVRWLHWNMTYHCVHHTWPSVPFHRLPELHREVEERLGQPLPRTGYFALHLRHLRELLGGKGELALRAEHDAAVAASRNGVAG